MERSVSFMPKLNCRITEENSLIKKYHLYVHMPFCKKKCIYCGINVSNCFNDFDLYINGLEKELLMLYNQNICGSEFISIHIGGGTPSLLSLSQMQQFFEILEKRILNFEKIEKVFEANPESLSSDKIKYLSSHKNMTLSIGIQTLNSSILHLIGRMMKEEEIVNILKTVVDSPFAGVGVDIICGLPSSTERIFLDDVRKLVSIGIDHLSIYPLWVEAESVLGKNYDKYKSKLMNEGLIEKCLTDMQKILYQNGYNRRSAYHYCKLDKNLFVYGNSQMYGDEWIGIGAGAVSFFNSIRKENIEQPAEYLCMLENNKLPVDNQIRYSISDELLNKLAYIIRKPVIIADDEQKELGEIGFLLLTRLMEYLKSMGFLKSIKRGWELTSKGVINIGMLNGTFIQNILIGDIYGQKKV